MPTDEAIAAMRAFRADHDLAPLVIHDSYLINCASADETIRAKSIAAMRGEMERAIAIGAQYLVMHPGSAKDQTLESGIETLARSLEEAARGLRGDGFQLLLENTAGPRPQFGAHIL